MKHVILLAGLPGSGKTTLTQALINHFCELRTIRYGELLFERCKSKYPEIEYNELRASPSDFLQIEDLRAVDNKVLADTAQIRKDLNVIVEIHTVTREDFGFRVMPYEHSTLLRLAPSAILLLSMDAASLRDRLVASRGLQRAPGVEMLERLAVLQQQAAIAYSVVSGAPLCMIEANYPSEEVMLRVLKCLKGCGVALTS